jgi:hypothetical protein
LSLNPNQDDARTAPHLFAALTLSVIPASIAIHLCLQENNFLFVMALRLLKHIIKTDSKELPQPY